MVTIYDSFGTEWVDLENPTKEELDGIREKYGLHPIVMSELGLPSARTKVDLYPNYSYLIFRFPNLITTKEASNTTEREIDFVIGKNFIITAHYEPIEPLYIMGRHLETSSLINKDHKIEHAGYMFYAIMRRLYQGVEDDLFYLQSHVKRVEAAIFAGEERRMVEEISKLNRVLINFWWSTRTHEELLSSFEIVAKSYWGESFHYYTHSLTGEYLKISKVIDGYKEVVRGLRETNDSLLTTKSNEIMKALMIVASAFLPINIISAIFSMNTVENPLLGDHNDFWIIVFFMIGVTALLMAFFKKKKWI